MLSIYATHVSTQQCTHAHAHTHTYTHTTYTHCVLFICVGYQLELRVYTQRVSRHHFAPLDTP